MRNPYMLACGMSAGHGVHGPTAGDDFKMFVYEFVGDLSRHDDPGLLSEDGEVVAHGYRATELLTRALLDGSMSAEDQHEVEKLLKRIFDPRGTVFCGRPFTYRWLPEAFSSGPALIFTRYASGAAGEQRVTKLILRFRNWAENDRSLVVLCMTYETLAPQADVRMT